jgi:hypothetical protein
LSLERTRMAKRIGLSSLVVAALWATPAAAQTGGSAAPGSVPPPPAANSGIPGQATIAPDGRALAPPDAPRAVRKAINAANKIRKKPYRYGGGHARWKDKGYDCSGAVSFALHAAGLLKTPMPSGPLARQWGTPGVGQWITVYANPSHAYVVIAGLRWDTSAVGEPLNQGSGPRWRRTARSPAGYTARYALGL